MSKENLLKKAIKEIERKASRCSLCPHKCLVNRLEDEKGICRLGNKAIVYAAFLHKGEEPPLVGNNGSGTIFFSGCNLKCIFCQNYRFSHNFLGKTVNNEELAEIMLRLQKNGAQNINLVTATAILLPVLKALLIAIKEGLNIPIIYNTSGYENKEILVILEGIIDIYLPDMKYFSSTIAKKYCSTENYPKYNQEAIIEMHHQMINYTLENDKKGLIIRHLIIPGYIEDTKKILIWIKNNAPHAYVSTMSQYQPYFLAYKYPEINRTLSFEEYQEISNFIEELGLEKGWIQEFNPPSNLAGVNFSQYIL